MERLSFEVENVELTEDQNPDSSFAILSLDFFASGLNKHNMTVSPEVLEKTANTIYNKPVVWKYDSTFNDIGTHDSLEVPAGFVKEGAEIKRKTMDDGRIMLSTIAYVWKKYSGRLLEFFKRDGNIKPVSVEITVSDSVEREDGLTELKNYVYEAITVLGSIITPAIPGANSSVLQFSDDQQEYQEAYKKEFSLRYDDVDFTISQNIKTNAQRGLDLYKENGTGGNSVNLAIARFLIKNNNITPQKIRHIYDFFLKHKADNFDKEIPNKEYISFLLYGGNDGLKWSKDILDQLNEIDDKHLSYFEEGNNKNADSTTSDESEKEKNMGEKEKMEAEDKKEEEVVKPEDKKEEMASEEEKKEPEKMEENTDSKDAEKKEEEKEDKDEEDKEKMSNDANMEAVLSFLKNETSKWSEVADEGETEEFANAFESKDFCKGMTALYSRMCKMSKCMEKMEEKEKAYMAEKAKAEEEQKKFEVEKTLKEMELSADIPQEKMEEMKTESDKFALKDIESWKNHCKAIAFDFAKKDNAEKVNEGIMRIGMPFVGRSDKQSNSLWG